MRENLRQLPSPPRPSPARGEGSEQRLRRQWVRGEGREPLRGYRSHGGIVLGLFIGLVIGVLIAFGVVWVLNKTPLPFQDNKGNHQERRESVPGQPPLPLAGKPGDKVPEKPRFDFYKILPGGQDATPASGWPATPAAPPTPAMPTPAPVVAGETIFLQAGAFQKAADADNLKAKLALLGVDTGVQEINIPDKGAMYRVRVGPFANLEEMNRARGLLSQNGIQATVVKVKEGSN
jgi:cell division protein FtsN